MARCLACLCEGEERKGGREGGREEEDLTVLAGSRREEPEREKESTRTERGREREKYMCVLYILYLIFCNFYLFFKYICGAKEREGRKRLSSVQARGVRNGKRKKKMCRSSKQRVINQRENGKKRRQIAYV
jgi:hypothetical protein